MKADAGSKSMEGLKEASNAVRKATDELVKAAQGTHEKTPFIKVKKDIFKEVHRLGGETFQCSEWKFPEN